MGSSRKARRRSVLGSSRRRGAGIDSRRPLSGTASAGNAAVSVGLGLAGGILAYWALRLRGRFELPPVIAWMAHRRRFTPEWYTPVEMSGLYWHFVDLVWVFIFALFYLW